MARPGLVLMLAAFLLPALVEAGGGCGGHGSRKNRNQNRDSGDEMDEGGSGAQFAADMADDTPQSTPTPQSTRGAMTTIPAATSGQVLMQNQGSVASTSGEPSGDQATRNRGSVASTSEDPRGEMPTRRPLGQRDAAGVRYGEPREFSFVMQADILDGNLVLGLAERLGHHKDMLQQVLGDFLIDDSVQILEIVQHGTGRRLQAGAGQARVRFSTRAAVGSTGDDLLKRLSVGSSNEAAELRVMLHDALDRVGAGLAVTSVVVELPVAATAETAKSSKDCTLFYTIFPIALAAAFLLGMPLAGYLACRYMKKSAAPEADWGTPTDSEKVDCVAQGTPVDPESQDKILEGAEKKGEESDNGSVSTQPPPSGDGASDGLSNEESNVANVV